MLKWIFGADTGPFKRGLSEMREQTKALAGSMKGQLASALGLGAIVAGFRRLFVEMDRVQKLGIRFGESAETIQRVGLAAELAGSDIEGVAKAMQVATRNALEAVNGTKSYQDTFKALGISAAEFVNMPMEVKLQTIAAALKKASGSGEAMALAQKLMGRSGADLIPLLSEIERQLKELEDRDFVSQGTVDSIAKFNDAITIAKQTVTVWASYVISAFQMAGETIAQIMTSVIFVVEDTFHGLLDLASPLKDGLKSALTLDVDGMRKSSQQMRQIAKTTFSEVGASQSRMMREYQNRMAAITAPGAKPGNPTVTGGGEVATVEAKAKLAEKIAKLEEDAAMRKLSIDEKLVALQFERIALSQDAVGTDEKALEARIAMLEVDKNIESLQQQIAANVAAKDQERKTLIEEIAALEEDAADRKLSSAEKLAKLEKDRADAIKATRGEDQASLEARKKVLGIDKEIEDMQRAAQSDAQAQLDKLGGDLASANDAVPSMLASDLASVGGGGPAALIGEKEIARRQTDIQQEMLNLLRNWPDGPTQPIEPTS